MHVCVPRPAFSRAGVGRILPHDIFALVCNPGTIAAPIWGDVKIQCCIVKLRLRGRGPLSCHRPGLRRRKAFRSRSEDHHRETRQWQRQGFHIPQCDDRRAAQGLGRGHHVRWSTAPCHDRAGEGRLRKRKEALRAAAGCATMCRPTIFTRTISAPGRSRPSRQPATLPASRIANSHPAARLDLIYGGPDDMPYAATLVRASLDLFDGEARAAQAIGELRVRRRRPNRQHAFWPQRLARGLEA